MQAVYLTALVATTNVCNGLHVNKILRCHNQRTEDT